MNQKNHAAASAVALLLIFAVFVGVLVGLNTYTGPIITENENAAKLAPLYEILPEAQGFTSLYDYELPAASDLLDIPSTVRYIYEETSGLGYGVRLSTTEGYTHDPIEIAVVIDAEGTVTAAGVTSYPDTRDMGVDTYPLTYVGQNSTLADVSLVAGVTFSSSAFKNAVNDAFAALIANGLAKETVKSPEQLLGELLPVVFPGIANKAGVAQNEEGYEVSGTYIQSGIKALNGSGFAFFLKDGEENYLAVVNAQGCLRVYDPQGEDVTDSVDAAITEEVLAEAAASQDDFTKKQTKRLTKLSAEGAELEALPLDGIYSTVVAAYRITAGDTVTYGFAARPYGYSNMNLALYYVLDETGAITAMNDDDLILIQEYFSDYVLDESSYKAGFQGLTADTFTGEQALISGATVSSEAVTTAVNDIFEAFATLKDTGVIA